MPQAPIIEPIERSNSPPIISSATATARMPELGRDLEVVGGAPQRQESAVAGDDREEDPDDDRAGDRAHLRPDQQPAQRARPGDALVAAPAAGRIAARVRLVTSASLNLTAVPTAAGPRDRPIPWPADRLV